jgi:hypothetical protein
MLFSLGQTISKIGKLKKNIQLYAITKSLNDDGYFFKKKTLHK